MPPSTTNFDTDHFLHDNLNLTKFFNDFGASISAISEQVLRRFHSKFLAISKQALWRFGASSLVISGVIWLFFGASS